MTATAVQSNQVYLTRPIPREGAKFGDASDKRFSLCIKGKVMTPLQEIVVRTNKGAWLTLHIIKASEASPFTAEVLAFEPAFNPQYSSLFSIAGSFTTAEAAFVAAFNWVVQFCKAREHSITHINNPCNCEFLQAVAQQQVVQQKGITVTVTVNA